MNDLRSGSARVRVPATSANLGPGYDSFGLALSLYDDLVARITDGPTRVWVEGEGASDVPQDESHLVVRAMRAAFDELQIEAPGLELRCTNRIPHGRGLGSSAAAVVAGLLLARELVADGVGRLPDREVLRLATGLEGHPDNAAAALFGGFTISWTADDDLGSVALPVAAGVVPVVCIPSWQLSTHSARGLLPTAVPHDDAALNVARAALLVAALTAAPARTDLLMTATQDRLHQDYRRSAYDASYELVCALRSAGLAAVVSGAGPSVLVLTDAEGAGRVSGLVDPRFRTLELQVAPGATAEPLDD